MEIQIQKAFNPVYTKDKNGKKMLRIHKKVLHKKRVTRLVRLSAKWHWQLKMMEMPNRKTISRRLDQVCELFFKHNPGLKVPIGKPVYTKDLLS